MKAVESFLVYITMPLECAAVNMAESLVDSGLCAGLNILGPGVSVYSWQGKTRKAGEWIAFAQVAAKNFPAFREALEKMHPHVAPCVVALPIEEGNEFFLKWILNPANSGAE